MYSIQCFLILVGLMTAFGRHGSILNETDPDGFDKKEYGNTWMYFPDGDDTPRRISLRMIPIEYLRRQYLSSSDDIEYRLYTRYNIEQYVLLDEFAKPANESDAQIVDNLQRAPIVFITHGWESSADKNAVINIKDAYLDTQDVNIIAVDWSKISESIIYPIVAPQTSKVGNAVGSFLDNLAQRYKVSGSQIHLIGHSLGAHVMGNAGHATSLTIGRITGLDPARPLFEIPSIPNSYKLDPSDAQFVDIIHTCSGILGVENPIGHADFFPNSGHAPQPGCNDLRVMLEACSHSRSHVLYVDSIRNPTTYPAYACPNWSAYLHNECEYANTYLGFSANRSSFGSFYLTTNDQKPFGRGFL